MISSSNFISFGPIERILESSKLVNLFHANPVYKIRLLSVHWSKSRQILVAHVSSKVMNENTLNKTPGPGPLRCTWTPLCESYEYRGELTQLEQAILSPKWKNRKYR